MPSYKFIRRNRADQIHRRLRKLYGPEAERLFERLLMCLGRYGVGSRTRTKSVINRWDEQDTVLIAYPDMLTTEAERPLETLNRFLYRRLRGAIRTVHLLPFFPWSSDDGFSVINYREVSRDYGKWADLEAIGGNFHLMFDLVLNHCSVGNSWFKDFVSGIAPARYYFLPIDPDANLSIVARPRSSPLLTPTMTRDGEVHLWTTFSADQVDLNWQNSDLFFEFLDILFYYISKGARYIRLDAVAFLWKELDTDCLHQPQTHEVVKLLRDILAVAAPDVVLLTETNVPHEDNISYFGRGDEAHMVYQFALPPLLLHALLKGDSSFLTTWAKNLKPPPRGCAFLNFTASHDGIGLRPVENLLPPKEIKWLIAQNKKWGGHVSEKKNPDGSKSPYELNITYFDALRLKEQPEHEAARFLCSQAVALSLKGIPAVYFNSLVGAENNLDGVKTTGEKRAINRKKWDLDELKRMLNDSELTASYVYRSYLKMLNRRNRQAAFHPDGEQEILDLGPKLFGLARKSTNGSETIVCLYNFTPETIKKSLPEIYAPFSGLESCLSVIKSRDLKLKNQNTITLKPYKYIWLKI